MLARIKEEYDRTGDTERAVGEGMRRSAPLIVAAAGILALSYWWAPKPLRCLHRRIGVKEEPQEVLRREYV
ncbi:hypothetical protein OG742_42235 [Streptomyces sp. NBC_00828]|uniref:hypothetical protein n=1 Tax=Streptomyces sp. NBC_00828 TaxID=2903678 RepID=UPI00386E3CE7